MKRVLTALIAIPIVLVLTIYAPDWLFALVLSVLSGLCADELMRLGSALTGVRSGTLLALAAAGVTLSFLGGFSLVMTVLPAALLVSLSLIALHGPLQSSLPRMAVASLTLLYCGVLPGFLIWLPRGMIMVLLAVVWAGDSAAYYGGRALGRHLLAPRISPKKTVEGALFGLAGSLVGGVALGNWLLDVPLGLLIAACTAAAIAGQIGDLVESAMKRSAGVKDSSALLPGHGGMLDRLDSLLFAAPVFYWFFNS